MALSYTPGCDRLMTVKLRPGLISVNKDLPSSDACPPRHRRRRSLGSKKWDRNPFSGAPVLRRLFSRLRPKPVQIVHVDGEAAVATWALNLNAVAAALDAQAEGDVDAAAKILGQRKARPRNANPSETLS